MKKLISIVLSAVLLGSMFTGCGSKPEPSPSPSAPAASPSAPAASPSASATDMAAASPSDAAMDTSSAKPLLDPTIPANTADPQPYIALVAKGFQHKYWQEVKRGADDEAKTLNIKITFDGPETEAMIDKQVDMFNSVLANNPQAICLAALDTKALGNQLKTAQSKNIPIVGFDSGVDSDIPVSTCATNNLSAGAAAADEMAKAIDNAGEVGIIAQDQTSETAKQRRDGFVNQIKDKYPNIKIVDIQYGDGDHLKSADAAKAIMTAHPDLKGLFGTNEGSAIGVLKGVQEMKKEGKVVIIGFDSSKDLKDAVRSGVIYGAVAQDPYTMGKVTVQTAYEAFLGKPVEKNIDTGFKFYTKDNMDQPDIAPLLYD